MHESDKAQPQKFESADLLDAQLSEYSVELRSHHNAALVAESEVKKGKGRVWPFNARAKHSFDSVLANLGHSIGTSLTIVIQATIYLIYRRIDRRSRVLAPPGAFIRQVLSFVFSKKAFETVFAQAILDMREEHAEALAGGQLWKARWIVLRDHINIGITVGFYVATSMGKKVIGIWKMIP